MRAIVLLSVTVGLIVAGSTPAQQPKNREIRLKVDSVGDVGTLPPASKEFEYSAEKGFQDEVLVRADYKFGDSRTWEIWGVFFLKSPELAKQLTVDREVPFVPSGRYVVIGFRPLAGVERIRLAPYKE